MSRLQLSPAVIAIFLVSTLFAQVNDKARANAPAFNLRTEGLVATPTKLGFGSVAVGLRKFQTVTITNWGSADIRLVQVITRGGNFDVVGLELPLTLARGERFTFKGVFAPRSKGSSSGTLSLVSDASGTSNPTLRLELTGMGTNDQQLIVDPATMNFGVVQIGSTATQMGSLTATSTQVTISSAFTNSTAFTLSGLSFPLTIPPGASQGFTVTFTPQTGGMVSAALSFVDENGIPLASESLNGTAVSSQSHSVELSWNASTSQNVIGYNVYRGNQSGGPYRKINSLLDPNTGYTDTSVTDGGTYYYVTTAVNSDKQESAYSNQAQATIP